MDPEPKDDMLWAFIARSLYLGVASYAVVIAVGFLRDYLRRYLLNYGPRSLHPTLHTMPKMRNTFIKYRDSKPYVFYLLELIRFSLNMLVCIIYVIGTYARNVPTYMEIIYKVTTSIFATDLLLRILFTESAFSFAFSLQVCVESFSYPSLLIASGPHAYLNLAFLRAIGLYQSYLVLERRLFMQMMSSRRLLIKLVLQNLVLFYTLAAAIQLLEIPGDLLSVGFRQKWLNFDEWNFLNACYFIIVTLSTVGYGDFSPATVQGRIFTLFIIIIGIVIFASVGSELLAHAKRGRGSGWFVKSHRTRHVIVTGTPNATDLFHFVSEFYSDPRDSNISAKIVVLLDELKWSEAEWYQSIAKNYFLQVRVQYLNGSVSNSLDLRRAGIETADAVFILSSQADGEDPACQDSKTIISALAIRNVRTDIPIYAQTLLENSNLQIHTALTSPSTFSTEETFFRGKEMHVSAAYSGLFHKVLQIQYSSFPQLYRKNGVQESFNEVVRKHIGEESNGKRYDSVYTRNDDLARSQLVCLQEIQMALMSGNIKANGVGTLLSNMYLDVQAKEITDTEPPWLSEYHMGASCGLVYAIVPKELHEVSLKDIAVELYHLGLIVIATSDARNIFPRPILQNDVLLQQGDLAMVLTYHETSAVHAALNLTALRYATQNLHHKASLRLFDSQGNIKGIGRLSSNGERDEIENNAAKPLGSTSMSPQLDRISDLRPSQSGDDLDALLEDGDLDTRQDPTSTRTHEGGSISENASSGPLPRGLKGHVIVAAQGEAPVDNMTLLLMNLWRKDDRKSLANVRRATVVIVHPSISDKFRQRFFRFEGKSLFFVEGPPTSRATWRKAKLNTAKAVATMADYTQKGYTTDSQTIFTLLTLDVSTTDDQNLFICSDLVEEKSLEYLREPLHARRRGAALGDPFHRSLFASQFRSFASGGEVVSEDGHAHREPAYKVSPQPVPKEVDERQEVQPSGSPQLTGGHQHKARRSSLLHLSSALNPGFLSELGSLDKGAARMAQAATENAIASPPGIEVDPAARPGAARARRRALFSRSRYASGELLVQSSATTLLVREYIEPGFVGFFTNILGTDSRNLGMKIRLVRIPPTMFDPRNGLLRSDGQKLVRYQTIFNSLIRIGVTPLGLYRSGTAPILLPSKSRKRRGTAVREELRRLLDQSNPVKCDNRFGGMLGGAQFAEFLRRVFGTVAEVLPHEVQQEIGKHEVHGVRSNSTSSTRDSGDKESSESQNEGPKNETNASSHRDNNIRRSEQNIDSNERVTPSHDNQNGGPGVASHHSKRLFNSISRREQNLEVPGAARYKEKRDILNLLPYVYTLPDPNTWCGEKDAVYVLCDPKFDLPENWTDTSDEVNRTATKDSASREV